jgi:hypothetical protein
VRKENLTSRRCPAAGVGITALLLCTALLAFAGPEADYGDARDPLFPSLHMTQSTSLPGRTGPYHLDTTQEWLGTSLVTTTTTESDALLTDQDDDDAFPGLWRALVDGAPIGQGYVSVPVSIASDADEVVRYLNVASDLNGDGVWGSYPVGQELQPEWVVKNQAIYAPPGTTLTIHVPFPIVDADGVVPGLQVWTRLTLTTESIDRSLFDVSGWDGSGPDVGFVRGETEDWLLDVTDHPLFPVPTGLIPPPDGPPPPPDGGDGEDGRKPGGVYKSNVPDIAQKPMECAPTSAANSLFYLADRHGFGDVLPGDADSPCGLIELLKDLMRWTEKGTSPDSFLQAKWIITEIFGLWMSTESQMAHEGRIPSLDFILEALDRCDDVEIFLYFDGGGGHAVTVVGYVVTPDGTVQLLINDPDDGFDGSVPYTVGRRGSYITLTDYPASNWIGCAFREFLLGESLF